MKNIVMVVLTIPQEQFISVRKKPDCELQDYEMWKRLSLRHEIFHAFLFESGFGRKLKLHKSTVGRE